jgi:hypothetical protein
MRYEDLHLRPLETFGGLVGFLGLPPDRDRLRRAIELSSFKALRKQEEEHGFRERSTAQERFFRRGQSGRVAREADPGPGGNHGGSQRGPDAPLRLLAGQTGSRLAKPPAPGLGSLP